MTELQFSLSCGSATYFNDRQSLTNKHTVTISHHQEKCYHNLFSILTKYTVQYYFLYHTNNSVNSPRAVLGGCFILRTQEISDDILIAPLFLEAQVDLSLPEDLRCPVHPSLPEVPGSLQHLVGPKGATS